MKNDFFKARAQAYDLATNRVANIVTIAGAIRQHIDLQPTMKIMGFGSGTGLLLQETSTWVHCICAVDISPLMHEQLEKSATS